ncbi:hypothetical protein BDZ91DRAFT_833239 [Kalaharituber pfeilii]|nr:hypothetical protein BDZ91DRAFT_833239 [Kalaharituber pfeilii]
MPNEMIAANLMTKVLSVSTIIWSGIDLSFIFVALIHGFCGFGVTQLLGATVYTILGAGLFVASGKLSHHLLGVPGVRGCEYLDLDDRGSIYEFFWEATSFSDDPNSAPTALQHARSQCRSWAQHWRLIVAVACLHILLAIILYTSVAYPYLLRSIRFRRRIQQLDVWAHARDHASTKEFQYEQNMCNSNPKLIEVLSIYEAASMIAKETHDVDMRCLMLASRAVRNTLIGSIGMLRLRQLTCISEGTAASTTECWSCSGKICDVRPLL